MIRFIPLIAIAIGVVGCSFHARSPEDYRKVTRELLETRNADIQACYDAALKDNPKASGTVIVNFKVEAETGKVTAGAMDEVASSAPATLGECIVKALDGLVLDPPDARTGQATFQWSFEIGPAPAG
jgi:hypothetical protein